MFFFRNCKTPKSIPTTARIFLGTYTAISGVWATYKALARALASRTLVAQGASPLCSLMPRKVAQAIQRPIVVAELVRAHSDSNPEEPAGCNGPSSLQVLQTPASKRRKTSSKVTAASPASCTSPPASTIIQEADHHATPPVGKKAKKSAAALFSPSPGAGSRDDPLLDLGSLVAGE